MEKLKSLNFDNANNAAISLHMLAEWVRAGDVTFNARGVRTEGSPQSDVLRMAACESTGRR